MEARFRFLRISSVFVSARVVSPGVPAAPSWAPVPNKLERGFARLWNPMNMLLLVAIHFEGRWLVSHTHKAQLWLEKIDFGTFGDEQFCSSRYRAQGASQVLLSWLGSPSTRVPTRVETFCHDRVDPSHPKPLPKIHQIPKISISIFRTSGDFGVPPASDCRILEAPRLRGCILC